MKKTIPPIFACMLFSIFFVGQEEEIFPKKVNYLALASTPSSTPKSKLRISMTAFKNNLSIALDGKPAAEYIIKLKPVPPGPLPPGPGPCDPGICMDLTLDYRKGYPVLYIKNYKQLIPLEVKFENRDFSSKVKSLPGKQIHLQFQQ